MEEIWVRTAGKVRKLLEQRGSSDTHYVSRAERLEQISRRVRDESMKVNAEFAAIERDVEEALRNEPK